MGCESGSGPSISDSIYSFDRTDGLSVGFLTSITDSTVSRGDSKSSKYCNASGVIWNPDSINRAKILRRIEDVNWSSMNESQVLVLNICHYNLYLTFWSISAVRNFCVLPFPCQCRHLFVILKNYKN